MKLSIQRLVPVILPMAILAGITEIHARNKAASAPASISMVEVEGMDRDTPLVPRNRPELAIYSARIDGEAQTKVFAQGPDGKPRLVYTDPESGQLVSVSADGTHGIFRRFLAPGQIVDIAVDFQKRQS
ncbi:hypothetical protein [Pendulispora albinea]|uniref:Uncharacterized protein n=1 Tax=Pendulispora albinea TaxID=2741071 RepID=A0ABZ2M0J2_9BACT